MDARENEAGRGTEVKSAVETLAGSRPAVSKVSHSLVSLRHGASELRSPAVVVPDVGQISTREVDSLAMDVDENSDSDHGSDEARATVADKWQRQTLCLKAMRLPQMQVGGPHRVCYGLRP